MSDLLVRLLNFNKSVFIKKEIEQETNSDKSDSKSAPEALVSTSEMLAHEIRQCTIFSVI